MQRHLAFICAYNKNMRGVDFADRIIKYYNCGTTLLQVESRNHLPPVGVVHPQCIRDRVVFRGHHGGMNNRLHRSCQTFRMEWIRATDRLGVEKAVTGDTWTADYT